MKKKEAILNGEPIEVVVELDDEDIEIYKPLGQELDQTLDLTNLLENTQMINIGDINECESKN